MISLYTLSLKFQAAAPRDNKGGDLTRTFQPKQKVKKKLLVNSLQGKKIPNNPWNNFYETHEEKFFKDRHYLLFEHTSLDEALKSRERIRLLDFGCGVGNAILPLLETIKSECRIEYLGVDVSSRAIQILTEKLKKFDSSCHVLMCKVLDLVNCADEEWEKVIEDFFTFSKCSDGFDYCLMIFTLSAFPPEKMACSIKRAFNLLKKGSGRICFRDYSDGDLAQKRFPIGQRISRNLYVRQDGTLSFFFHKSWVNCPI